MAPKDRLKELFRAPAPLTAMDRTTQEARQIINDQAERRKELTANLRAARLAKEASEAGKAATPPKKRKK